MGRSRGYKQKMQVEKNLEIPKFLFASDFFAPLRPSFPTPLNAYASRRKPRVQRGGNECL